MIRVVLERCGGVLDALVACAGVTALATGPRPAPAAAEAPRVTVVGSIAGNHPNDPGGTEAYLAGDEEAARARAEEVLAGKQGHTLHPSSRRRWPRGCAGSA